MSAEYPVTVEEWASYISRLKGADLRRQAIAANTLAFVEDLQDDGLEGAEIVKVFNLFALQFYHEGAAPPVGFPGEYLSLPDMLVEMGYEVPG
jgi:hypothetical protein